MKIVQTQGFPNAEFEVTILSTNNTVHKVKLDEGYYNELTDKKIEAKELIQRSFDFLLEREPNTSILSEFNLKRINDYFTEFEEQIRGSIQE